MTSTLPDVDALAAAHRSRAVAAGVDGHQYDQVSGALSAPSDWPSACRRTGRQHLDTAREAERLGRSASAGAAYLHASAWFHVATIVPSTDRAGHAESADALRRALGHLDPGARFLRGDRFTAVLRRPRDADALVVIVPGLDSSAEEFVTITETLLTRGLAVLAVNGPGQGDLAPTTVPTPDYAPVIDEALNAVRADGWAPRAVGLLALSLGGFYGATTLAARPDIAAGALVSGVSRLSWDDAAPLLADILTVRAGGRDAAREFARRIDLGDTARRITQPLLVVEGSDDVIPGATNCAAVAGQAAHGEYREVPGGDHLVGNARWAWLPHTADWLTDRLTG